MHSMTSLQLSVDEERALRAASMVQQAASVHPSRQHLVGPAALAASSTAATSAVSTTPAQTAESKDNASIDASSEASTAETLMSDELMAQIAAARAQIGDADDDQSASSNSS